MSSRGTQVTNWCFTYFDEPDNPLFKTVDEFAAGLDRFYNQNKGVIGYICGQVERSPTTDARHFQGYVQLRQRKRMLQVKKLFKSKTIHVEAQRASSNSDARDYCRKEESRDGEFQEYGEFKIGRQGQRTDVTQFRDAIMEGTNLRELTRLYPNEVAKFPRFFSTVSMMVRPVRPEGYQHQVVLCYGDPGTGKTRYSRGVDDDFWQPPLSNGTMWFDGYDKNKVAILDDFAGAASKITLPNTLALFDRYPIAVPIKGGHCWWMPEVLIVTTNIHPRGWYKWDGREMQWDALKRRFTKILIFRYGEEYYEHDPDDRPEERSDDWYAVHRFDGFFEDRDLWPLLSIHNAD